MQYPDAGTTGCQKYFFCAMTERHSMLCDVPAAFWVRFAAVCADQLTLARLTASCRAVHDGAGHLVPPAGRDGRDHQLRRLQRLTNAHALRTMITFADGAAQSFEPQLDYRCPAPAVAALTSVDVHLVSSAGLTDVVACPLECALAVRVPMSALCSTGACPSRAALAALVNDVAAVAKGATFPLPMGAGTARLLSWTASQSRFDVTMDVRGQPQRIVPALLRGSLDAMGKCLRSSSSATEGDKIVGAFVVRQGVVSGCSI